MTLTTAYYLRIEPPDGEPLQPGRVRVWRASDIGFDGERFVPNWRWICAAPHWYPPGTMMRHGTYYGMPTVDFIRVIPPALGSGTAIGSRFETWADACRSVAEHWRHAHAEGAR